MPFGRALLATMLYTGLLFVCVGAAPAADPVELLANGGFEWDDWEWRGVWGHYGHDVTDDEAHSGNRSMHFWSSGAIRSQRYTYNGGPIRVRGWYRLQDVEVGKRPYDRLWITVNFSDAAGEDIGHLDVFGADGTCEWTRFDTTFASGIEGGVALELSVALSNCSGRMWVDDLQIEADASLPKTAWQCTERPFYSGEVLPRPRRAEYGDTVPIWDAARRRPSISTRLGETPCRGARYGAELIDFRLAAAARYAGLRDQATAAPWRVVVHLGRLDDAHVVEIARRFGIDLPSLPEQGHFITMVPFGDSIYAIAAGADDMGVAYAAASIVQMIGFEGDHLILRRFSLTDWPDFLWRASGDYGPVGETWLRQLVASKVSMYAIQHRNWWKMVGPESYAEPRQGFSYEKLLGEMKQFADRTGAIDTMMLVHIYIAGGPPEERAKPVFDIADDDQVADLTRRLKWLYGIGVATQMICVDDYTDRRDQQYVCKTEAEQQRFGRVGRAHGYLMRRLWEELSPTCPDLRLSLVTAPYSMSHLGGPITEEAGRQYFADMAQEIPRQVALVWTGPRITSPTITKRHYLDYSALVPGRPLYIWDNNQAGAPYPLFDVDFYPGMHRDSAWSLIFNNSHFVGWPNTLASALCANAYEWNQHGYNAHAAHEAACKQAYGPDSYAGIRTVNDGYRDASAIIKGGKLGESDIVGIVDATYAALDGLDAQGVSTTVPRRQLSAASITPAVKQRFELIPEVTVPRAAGAISVDGSLGDAGWASAVALSAFEHYRNSEQQQFQAKLYPTTCHLAYDDAALYIGCSMDHQGVELHEHENVGKRDGSIFFNSDTIEVFIATAPVVGDYYHLAADHTQTTYDERRPGEGSNWNGEWQVAVSKGEGVWHLEMRIPFATLGVETPQAGDIWRANVCRAFGQQENQLSCWARIYGSFHNPTFWGRLVFE